MKNNRKVHPDFQFYLDFKEKNLIDLYIDLRAYIIEIYPECNELLYHTHALTSVYSLSDKLTDAFCMIPVYTNHLNAGFNKGTLLNDPDKLLKGTGKLIRHLPIESKKDYRNKKVKDLLQEAVAFAIKDMDKPTNVIAQTISRIKK